MITELLRNNRDTHSPLSPAWIWPGFLRSRPIVPSYILQTTTTYIALRSPGLWKACVRELFRVSDPVVGCRNHSVARRLPPSSDVL